MSKQISQKAFHFAFLTLLFFSLALNQAKAKSGFEIYGDVMQFLPFAMMIYDYTIDDMQGIKEQAIGTGVTFLSTHAIKQSFALIAQTSESTARISQRPNNGSFDGFPSGHTSFIFSVVGYAQKRYGLKWSIPLGLAATAVGVSRVYAEKHTITQVISGAILGFMTSYFLASPYEKNSTTTAWISNAQDNTPTYNVSYVMRF